MFVQKFNFIVMKMHKNVATRAAPFGSYAPNRLSAGALPQTHWGSLHRSPDPLAGLGVGPTGNRKEAVIF